METLILLVGAEPELAARLREIVTEGPGSRLEVATWERVRSEPPGAVLLGLADPSWRALLEPPGCPLVVLAGPGQEAEAREAMAAGAHGWIPTAVLSRALLDAALQTAEARLRGEVRARALGQTFRVVSHQINNALSAILMYGDLLAEGLPPGDPRRDAATGVGDSARRAASLVRALLACDRPGLARPRRVDLSRLVGDVAPILVHLLGRMEMELEPDLAPVHADPARLTEVLMTLAVLLEERLPGSRAWTLAAFRLDPGRVTLEVRWDEGSRPLSAHALEALSARLEGAEVDAGPGRVRILLTEEP